MKVTLDVSAVPKKPAGAGLYILELAKVLQRADLELGIELECIARKDDAARFEAFGGVVRAVVPRSRPARLIYEQVRLPKYINHATVHHSPHYTMPERTSAPVVVTVHDCTFFDHPEWHERTKVWLFERAINMAAKRAAVVITVSQYTANRLAEETRLRAPVMVVPHGVDHNRFSPIEPAQGHDKEALRALGLDADRPYVLFVGTLEPRKNVPGLIEAYGRIMDKHQDVDLVIAGQSGWGANEVDEAIKRVDPSRSRIRVLGYVDDVPALIRKAVVVAYPSFDEGFGLPALEAMACGTAVITSGGSAMEEFARGVALIVEPGDDEGLAQSLDFSLVGLDQLVDRKELGVERARAMTWEASAIKHLEAYRMAE